jgi:hypothetical protein
MLTHDEHVAYLRGLEVESLLTLLVLEAKKSHSGHYAILCFNSGWKVAFGIPEVLPWGGGAGYAQVAAMDHFPTLKEAVIAALVAGKDFDDYFQGEPETWWQMPLEGRGPCHACGQAANHSCDTCRRWLCEAHTFLRRQAWDQCGADGVDVLCADHAEAQPGWVIDAPRI